MSVYYIHVVLTEARKENQIPGTSVTDVINHHVGASNLTQSSEKAVPLTSEVPHQLLLVFRSYELYRKLPLYTCTYTCANANMNT